MALARRIKRGERQIRFRYAPEALSARMYRTTAEMVEGWTKNLAILFPSPVLLAFYRVLDVVLYFGLPVLAVMLAQSGMRPRWEPIVVMLLWVRTVVRFYGRVARSNFPAVDVAISILGVPLFVGLLVRSYVHHRVNKVVEWKGRRYGQGS